MVDFSNSLKRFRSLKELAEKNNGYIEPTLYVSEIETIISALEIPTDRDVAKEVWHRSMFQSEAWDYLVECPTCKKFVYMGSYCSRCGQKLSITGTVRDLTCKEDGEEW